jgi:hypothetical protein
MTVPVAMDHCPADETLAAFIDGRLDASARDRVMEHIAVCAECRDVVLSVHELEKESRTEPEGGSVSRFPKRAKLAAAAAVVAAAAAMIVVFGPLVADRSERTASLQQLESVSERLTTRPLKGRLSGDFAYARVYVENRGEESADLTKIALDSISQKLRELAAGRPTAANLHAKGVVFVYEHKYDEAVASMQQAVLIETGESDPLQGIRKSKDAQLLTDLSAALLRSGEGPALRRNRALSVAAATRAWELEQTPVIAWNRAMALQEMGVRDAALRAWQDYLKLDGTSQWAAEAHSYVDNS